MAARKDARPIASAKKLDSNVLLFVNVKENVQLIENMNCWFFFCKFTPIIKLNNNQLIINADMSAIVSGSISKNVQKVLFYMYTNFGAFIIKLTIVVVCCCTT